MPLDRTGSIDQPLLYRFWEKVVDGNWCHIFPEGRVWQNWRFDSQKEAVLGKFKAGVGKIIAHSYPNDPIVLPMYHKGMSNVVPEKILSAEERAKKIASKPASILPKTGNNIEVYFGKPMKFHDKLKEFDQKYPGELQNWKTTLPKIQLYRYITEEIRQEVLKLESQAYGRIVSTHAVTQQ
jgi:1-acyl-sn-glycerol-3-phosphate acyltransferase